MPDDLMAALEASLGEAVAKRRKAPKTRARAAKKSPAKAKARSKA